MRRLLLIPLLVLIPLTGCGDSSKSGEPKLQGTPDPNIKRLNQKPNSGAPGGQPTPQPGGGGKAKATTSDN